MRLVQPAALLRAGRFLDADTGLIAEDIERIGKTERRERVSRLNNLLLHLLKWQFQPSRREFSWRNSIRIQRREVAARMADNPTLQVLLGAAIDQAYGTAVIEAETETGLNADTFPPICPYTYEQMMAAQFWPDET